MWMSPLNTWHASSDIGRLSWVLGSVVRHRQWPFSWFFFCPLLLAWKHVQLPHHSVSAAVSLSPRLKTAKGPPGKVAHPISQDLCQKCFSPQVICYSLGPFRYYFKGAHKKRGNKREKWKGGKMIVSSDRSTFLSIDMRSEWGVLLLSCSLKSDW